MTMKNAQSKKSFSGWLPASLWLIPFLLIPFQAHGSIIPIDLKAFFADYSVTVATDGRSAVMEEDPGLSPVLLSNDPYLGAPGINVPDNLLGLGFTYSFSLGEGNYDNFYAKVFNGVTGDILADSPFPTESSSAGTILWDLSGIDPAISLLGLEFQLNSYSGDWLYDSVVTINNPHL